MCGSHTSRLLFSSYAISIHSFIFPFQPKHRFLFLPRQPFLPATPQTPPCRRLNCGHHDAVPTTPAATTNITASTRSHRRTSSHGNTFTRGTFHFLLPCRVNNPPLDLLRCHADRRCIAGSIAPPSLHLEAAVGDNRFFTSLTHGHHQPAVAAPLQAMAAVTPETLTRRRHDYLFFLGFHCLGLQVKACG